MPTGPEAALPAPRLHAVLAAVRAMNAATDDAFLPTVLRAAADLLPCDSVAYHELDTRGPAPRERRQLVEPRYAGRGAPVEAYHRHLAQHPVFAALAGDPLATGTCVALSDVVAAAGFRRLPLYTEYYRHRRIADQLVAVIGGSPGRTASLVVNRSRRGFSPADRAVLRLFLPHLQQALRHRARVARLGRAAAGPDAAPPGGPPSVATGGGPSHGVSGGALTPRQRQVVGWVATAATDQQIGRALGISGRTVGKHLENVYRKLGLSGRAELIAASAPPTRRQLSQAG